MMYNFFIQPDDVSNDRAVLRGQEAHHFTRVLRLKVNDEIILFDGTGSIYKAVVEEITKSEVQTRVISEHRHEEPRFSLHIGMPFLKGKKIDFVIQKATELGVKTISPYVSAFSATGRDVSHQNKRLQRWKKRDLEACKQCGRPVPLDWRQVSSFGALITEIFREDDNGLKIIFWEKEQNQDLKIVEEWVAAKKSGAVFCLVGPEGGFSDNEVTEAIEVGFHPVTFGQRILRSETALLTAMGIVQYLLGNLRK